MNEERLAARVQLVTPGEQTTVLTEGKILAIWTDEEELSTKISSQVAHYTGQAELAQAIQDGLERRRG